MRSSIRRRAFLIYGLSSAGISPHAQSQSAGDLTRVAILSPDPAIPVSNRLAAFLEALRALGDVEGRNISLDIRFAENRLDRLPALAAELVKARPAVIYTYTSPAAFAAAGATIDIPIVVGPAGEQTVKQLAGDFARPVANVTGLTLAVQTQDEKCLQLLKEAAPGVSRIALLGNPDNPTWRDYPNALKGAADQLGLVLIPVESRDALGIGEALNHYSNGRVGGILLVDDSTLAGDSTVRARVIQFAREQSLPSASSNTTYARDGGLLSLGTDMGSIFRRAAEYVHRIVHGTRPSDLPVERPTKLELVINLKTAKAIDLTIPPQIIARADEVIE